MVSRDLGITSNEEYKQKLGEPAMALHHGVRSSDDEEHGVGHAMESLEVPAELFGGPLDADQCELQHGSSRRIRAIIL